MILMTRTASSESKSKYFAHKPRSGPGGHPSQASHVTPRRRSEVGDPPQVGVAMRGSVPPVWCGLLQKCLVGWSAGSATANIENPKTVLPLALTAYVKGGSFRTDFDAWIVEANIPAVDRSPYVAEIIAEATEMSGLNDSCRWTEFLNLFKMPEALSRTV